MLFSKYIPLQNNFNCVKSEVLIIFVYESKVYNKNACFKFICAPVKNKILKITALRSACYRYYHKSPFLYNTFSRYKLILSPIRNLSLPNRIKAVTDPVTLYWK